MRIRNILDLLELEKRIETQMRRYELDEILLGLRETPENVMPFMIAGTVMFAMRYARAPVVLKARKRSLPWKFLKPLTVLVNEYLLADPVSFEPQILTDYHGSTSIPLFLRMTGSQLPYEDNFWGQYSRSLKLFRDLPRKLNSSSNPPAFDIERKFLELNGVSLSSFIDVGVILHAAALSNSGFVGSYFQKARECGINLPDDIDIWSAVDQFTADIPQFRQTYEMYRQKDRNYGAYDFNPLRIYPILRPWTNRALSSNKESRFIAPLPHLVLPRMSEGIYGQLFHRFRDQFSTYFGILFENYVGEILENSFLPHRLMSEKQIRQTYKSDRGKTPDWIVFEDRTATLIECKATGLSSKALVTGDQLAVDYSIDRIVDGLVQLHEFKNACLGRVPGLERLHHYSKINLVVVTYERFYIVNSQLFRQVIDMKLKERLHRTQINLSNWYVFSIDELEKLQPHIQAGFKMDNIFRKLRAQNFNDVLNRCYETTSKTYRDCFLYNMDVEIYRRLNVPLDD